MGGVLEDASVSGDGIEAQVRQLREAGLTPKLIARKVGIPVSAASRMVAAIAAKRPPSDLVTDCWVSPGWSRALDGVAGRRWPDAEVSDTGTLGLVAVLLARPHRHDRVSVCGYLVDVHCLGVKNAVGPRVMDQRELLAFRRSFFAGFHADPVPAPVELAQHLVLGAVEYARGLGFEPHPDFAAAARHLGDWTGPSDITFGREGKPCYVQGPHDNPTAVIQTLNRTVGQGNYDYVIAVA